MTIFKTLKSFGILSILGLSVFAAICYGQKRLVYETFDQKTKIVSQHFDAQIKDLNNGTRIKWVLGEGEHQVDEEYILGKDFSTKWFKVVNKKNKTDYVGERMYDTVFIRGVFNGDVVDKTMRIDDKPFYFNPKFGLKAFVLSGDESIKFWGMRNDALTVHLLKAVNQGREKISIGEKEIDAVKVYWTTDDVRSVFFKRTYWFRESDGLYLKQEYAKDKVRELISEK